MSNDQVKEKRMLKISKGPIFEMTVGKDLVHSITHLSDGVTIKLKNGIDINCIDTSMPIHTKQMIENSLNRFFKDDNNVTIDLLNYNKPVQIFAV